MTSSAASGPGLSTSRERRQSVLILVAVTGGHAVSHFLYQAFLVMLPVIKSTLGLGALEIGAIATARQMAGGLSSLPGGIICDRLRRHWGLVLAVCLVGFGLGWLLVSVAASYWLLMVGMVILAVAGSTWHLPAMAALSQRYAGRRGTALAIHGSGGTIGDVIGPFLTGLLLAHLFWRGVLAVYALLPIALGIAVYFIFRDIQWLEGEDGTRSTTVREMLTEAKVLFSNVTLWQVNLVAGVRDMCYQAYTTFLPLYLAEELGMDTRGVGLHLGLLFTMGLVAGPIMGYLSDRVGRMTILIPTMAILAALTVALALWGQGIWLTIIIVVLGLFMRSDYSLLSAMVLDIVGHGVATTTLGIMSFVRFVLGAISPLIAGLLYDHVGMKWVFLYSAVLYAVGALILLAVRMPRTGQEKMG